MANQAIGSYTYTVSSSNSTGTYSGPSDSSNASGSIATFSTALMWTDCDTLEQHTADTGNSITWIERRHSDLEINPYIAKGDSLPEAEITITDVEYARHDYRIYVDENVRFQWKVWCEAGRWSDSTQIAVEDILDREGDTVRRWYYVERHNETPVQDAARRLNTTAFDREARRLAEEASLVRQQELDGREAERKSKSEAAEKVAQELLASLIGEDQIKVYEETGRLFVKGEKVDYILQKSGMVKMIEKDKIIDLCIHLKDKLECPPTDNVIALKLTIEGDEGTFIEIANRHESEPLPAELPKAACM